MSHHISSNDHHTNTTPAYEPLSLSTQLTDMVFQLLLSLSGDKLNILGVRIRSTLRRPNIGHTDKRRIRNHKPKTTENINVVGNITSLSWTGEWHLTAFTSQGTRRTVSNYTGTLSRDRNYGGLDWGSILLTKPCPSLSLSLLSWTEGTS